MTQKHAGRPPILRKKLHAKLLNSKKTLCLRELEKSVNAKHGYYRDVLDYFVTNKIAVKYLDRAEGAEYGAPRFAYFLVVRPLDGDWTSLTETQIKRILDNLEYAKQKQIKAIEDETKKYQEILAAFSDIENEIKKAKVA